MSSSVWRLASSSVTGTDLGILHHEVDLLLVDLVVAERLVLQQQGVEVVLMHLQIP